MSAAATGAGGSKAAVAGASGGDSKAVARRLQARGIAARELRVWLFLVASL